MSIATLTQVYDEVRRLAIAGSSVAPGDFRLKKLIAPLEQAGAKAPVFAKVAQAVQTLVDSTEKTASPALLELTTLVSAVLYTQGETGIEGPLEPIPTTDLGIRATQTSARAIKPLVEALSTTGSGRVEIVRDAIDRKLFHDLRLVRPAVRAIDDPYPEIADLIAEHVLPLYGKAILPELRAGFDLKSKSAGHQRRLKLMHRLDPAATRGLVQQALEEGSKEVRVTAIECLDPDDADDLAFLLEQTKAKAKEVRVAALRSLAASKAGGAGVLTVVQRAIDSADLGAIVDRVRKSPSPAVAAYVLMRAKASLDALLGKGDEKEKSKVAIQLLQLLQCMERRTDAEAEAFLIDCLKRRDRLSAVKGEPSGKDVNEYVAKVMSEGSPALQQRLIVERATLPTEQLTAAAVAARASMTPAEFFDAFSGDLGTGKPKRGSGGAGRHDAITYALKSTGKINIYSSWVQHRRDDDPARKLPELDPRWLDAAIASGDVDLVFDLARPGHAGLNAFLSDRLKAAKVLGDVNRAVGTMMRVNHPAAAESIVAAYKLATKGSAHGYHGQYYGYLLSELPKSAIPAIEAAIATLPDDVAEPLRDGLLSLKAKPD